MRFSQFSILMPLFLLLPTEQKKVFLSLLSRQVISLSVSCPLSEYSSLFDKNYGPAFESHPRCLTCNSSTDIITWFIGKSSRLTCSALPWQELPLFLKADYFDVILTDRTFLQSWPFFQSKSSLMILQRGHTLLCTVELVRRSCWWDGRAWRQSRRQPS